MTQFNNRLMMLAAALFALALLALATTAFATGGDYGVNTGASTSNSACGGTGQPACTLNWSGYGLTFVSASGGWAYYNFDDFDCNVAIWLATNESGARGSQCDQYQPDSS